MLSPWQGRKDASVCQGSQKALRNSNGGIRGGRNQTMFWFLIAEDPESSAPSVQQFLKYSNKEHSPSNF